MMIKAKQNAQRKNRGTFTSSDSERLTDLAEEIRKLASEFARPNKDKPRILVRR